MRNDFRQIKKQYSNRWVFERLRIPHSEFQIPYLTQIPPKTWRSVNKFTFTALSPFFVGLKPYSHGKKVIESMQSLGMDNFRVAYTRFLAFYSDNPSGLRDGETPAKWLSKASFTTHPSTETDWPPKLLRRFSSWRIELHNDMQESP